RAHDLRARRGLPRRAARRRPGAGRAGTTPTRARPRLKYAEMVIMESLRLYPPAYGLGRQATTASEIAGQRVGRGDIFIVPTWVIHRDRRSFEEPESFRPERWAKGLAQSLPRFAYFP